MTADATSQLRRLLQIIPKLNDGKSHSLDDVARVARTDRDTVLRDLLSLSNRFGEPGGFVPGLQVYVGAGARQVSVRTSHFKRPPAVSAPELRALELGLAMLRNERPTTAHRVIDSARDRLRKAAAKLAPGIGPSRYHAEMGATPDSAHLESVQTAVRERRKVRITYRAAAAPESTSRVVCPYGLVAARGAWYIVAYCDDRKAVRIFRMDRVEDAKLLAATFDRPASFSVDHVIHDGRVLLAADAQTVRIRYSPKVARWIAERERVPLGPDGSVTVEYPLADIEWAVRHALQYAPDAEVLAPATVRLAIRDRLERLLSTESPSESTVRPSF